MLLTKSQPDLYLISLINVPHGAKCQSSMLVISHFFLCALNAQKKQHMVIVMIASIGGSKGFLVTAKGSKN